MEGLKNKEIAEILELSLEVVKARRYRGKIKLRKTLLENCTFYWDARNELACDLKCPKEK
jgi:FixJ family two-component response regulator